MGKGQEKEYFGRVSGLNQIWLVNPSLQRNQAVEAIEVGGCSDFGMRLAPMEGLLPFLKGFIHFEITFMLLLDAGQSCLRVNSLDDFVAWTIS